MRKDQYESLGDGIYRSKLGNGRGYYIRVFWRGHNRYEKASEAESASQRAHQKARKAAMALSEQRAREIDAGTYLPPRERKRRAARKVEDRDSLRYETAVERFLKAEGKSYADPREVEQRFERMGLYFNGWNLADIRPQHVREFFNARLNNTGPYKKRRFKSSDRVIKRKPSRRTPQLEVNLLSSLFGFVQDAGHEIANPCLKRSRRRSKKKSETYTPQHVPIIPSQKALRSMFEADPKRVRSEHRTFVKLAYYLGARPESELCTLTHGDVILPDPNVKGMDGKPVLGRVIFVNVKTGGKREVPLHPEAAEALRQIMRPGAKKSEPIFAKRKDKESDPSRPWDKASYKKAWTLILGAVIDEHPELEGMWLRDLRKTFRTRLTDAKIPEPTIMRLMGHSLGVSMSYHVLTPEGEREAMNALTVLPTRDKRQAVKGQDV